MSSKGKQGSKRLQSLRKKQEGAFQIRLTGSELPEYKAELDPYCPRAQVRKFNQDKKLDAEQRAEKIKNSSSFIKKKIHRTFEDVPIKFNPSLRAKATSAASSTGAVNAENVEEVEILQKVIVRENLLEELKKLLAHQTDVTGCLPEVIELVKAIRYQTVEIIEEISNWQAKQPTRRAFLYRGINYLTKIFEDMTFLDLYEDIVEKFCFEFTGNPLAYRGGGDIVTGPGGSSNAQGEGMQRLSEFYNNNQGSFDGIEIVRLRNAEKVIQMEFDRLEKEKRIFAKQQQMTPQQRAMAQAEAAEERGGQQQSMAIGELGFDGSVAEGVGGSVELMMSQDALAAASFNLQQREAMANGGKSSSNKLGGKVPKADPRKWRQKFNPRKVKMERIQVLTAEADELRAMETHLEDQINTMVSQHHELGSKRKVAEDKRREALASDREVAAQHFTVEISICTSDMQDLNAQIKDLQRQIYFIAIERNRKRKVAKKLKDELKLEKKRAELEAELSVKVKEGGLLNALKTLNTMQTGALEGSLGVQGEGGQPRQKDENSILEYIEKFKDDSLAEARSSPGKFQVQFEENEHEFGEQSRMDGQEGDADGTGGAYDHVSTRDLADAALAGMRAGRSSLAEDNVSGLGEEKGGGADGEDKDDYDDDDEGVAVGSAMAMAKKSRGARRPSDGTNAKVFLQQAQDQYDLGEYGDARELLEDILNPVEGSVKTGDMVTLLGAHTQLAEWHRSLAQYEEAESLYIKCISDVEDLQLPTEDQHVQATLRLRILVGYADLLRNLCLYDELDNIMYKAEKASTSLNAALLKEGANGFRLAVAECRTSQAGYLVAKGDYDEAEKLHMEALDLRRQVLGMDHFKVASSLSHLGNIALLKSDFRKASRLIGESLAMREAIFPKQHPAIAASLYLKGHLLFTIGQYKEAGPLLAKSLRTYKICLGQKHPSVGQVLLAIGELSREMGLPLKAAESYQNARAVLEKRFPDGGRCHGHQKMVEALIGLGNNAFSMHEYSAALALYDEANERHESHLPDKIVSAHIFREVLHLKRARALVEMDRFEEASDIVSSSGQVVVSKLGNDHHLVATGLLVFGRLCSLTAKHAQAHLLFARAEEMFKTSFGDEHPILVEVMYCNTENMRLPGYYEDAVHEEGRAMQLGNTLHGHQTSHRALSLLRRAVVLRDVGRHTEAETLFSESAVLLEETVGVNGGCFAMLYGEHGECLRRMGRHEEADQTLSKGVALTRAAYSTGSGLDSTRHPHSAVCLFEMYRAQTLLDLGKPDEALELLEGEVYPPLRSLLGERHPATMFAKALCALCLARSKTPRTERSFLSADLLEEQPQDIIDEILDALDTHDSGKSPYSESHPWVHALGGYVLDTARDSRTNSARRSARDASARGSARGGAMSFEGLDGGNDDMYGGARINPEIVPWDAPGKEGKDFDRIQGKIVFRSATKFDGEKAGTEADLTEGLRLAQDRMDMGKYEEAKDIVEDVLKARRRMQMGNNQTVIACRLLLAEWHRGMAQYKHAESLYSKCLAVMQSQEAEQFPQRHLLHLGLLVGLADLYRNTCQYRDVCGSHQEAERVIALATADGSARDIAFQLVLAECRASQAGYLVAKGDYDEAEKLHKDCLDLRRQVLGVDHFKVASSLSHLGNIALLKSDFRKASLLVDESLSMREAIFPKQHPAIAASLYLKGRLLCAMAQYKEAGPLLTESLTLRRTSLGQRHPSVAQCECAIADLTLALGYTGRAEEHYDEALLLRQQFFPEFEVEANRVVWHMDVVESLGGNAALLEAKGDFLKATETYAEAITQLHRLCQTMDLFDGSHPLMVVLQVRLARIYITLNKISEAKHLLKSAGDVVYGKLGDRHLVAVELHLALGLLCNHEGWYRDAQESYSKARKVLWVLFKKHLRKSPIKPKLDLKGAGIGSTADASVTTDVLTTPVDTLPERRMNYRDVDPDFTEASSDATHPLVADTLHHMAYNVGVGGPGYAKRAEELCERATEIRKGLFGKHYLDPEYDGANKGNNENNFQCTCLAASMLLRAQIAAVLREFGVAQNCFELALRISHQATGDASAHFAIVFAAYGCYLLQRAEAALHASTVSQGDPDALFEEADDTLSKALVLLRERLGDGHWLVADTMQQISFLLLYRGQVDEALALMKDGALPLFEEALGHNNPRTLFVGGCVGVTLQAAAKAALAGQGTTEGGSEVDTTHARSMSNSGHELVKSTLNFFRLYAQGAMVPTHPWVVMVGGYEVLLQKPQPKDAPSVLTAGDMSTLADDASAGGGGASVMSVDTAIDRELEEIKEDLALIPKKPELGLLFNSNASNIRDLTTLWGLD